MSLRNHSQCDEPAIALLELSTSLTLLSHKALLLFLLNKGMKRR